MKYFNRCPIPKRNGGDCWEPSHPASEYGLCVEHWREVTKGWFDEEPAVTIRCYSCHRITLVDPIDLEFARCEICAFPMGDSELILSLIEAEELESHQKRANSGVVYYVKFGNRLKIGFTSSLRARVNALLVDEVLAAEPGTYDIETARHKQFAEYLAAGREWFHPSPELLAHVASIRAEHGDPFEVKWSNE